ncbi:MAG: glycoside hydrolase family 2 protein [Terriglobia bacterium]
MVNYSGGDARGLTAQVEVRSLDGALSWEKTTSLDCPEDSTISCIKMEYPAGLTPVQFLLLKLTRGEEILSSNFYWRGSKEGDYRALRELPKVKLAAATRVEQRGSTWHLTTELHNVSKHPALMVRVKAVREKSGDRILPAFFSDNYIALMPGDRRTIRIELENSDTRGEKPRVVVEGFNTQEVKEE